jgi:hypothetical protein
LQTRRPSASGDLVQLSFAKPLLLLLRMRTCMRVLLATLNDEWFASAEMNWRNGFGSVQFSSIA